MLKIHKEILSFFPDSLKEIKELDNELIWDVAEEIRIRIGQAIAIKLLNDEIFTLFVEFSDKIQKIQTDQEK